VVIDPDLRGKVALITGANRGIGAAAARTLATQGASVFLTQFGEPRADALVEWIVDRGGLAVAHEVDLATEDVAPALFEHAEATLGAVCILVNNAATRQGDSFLPPGVHARDALGRPLHGLEAGSHDLQFRVNARAPALLMQEFARRHIERGARWGRIVNLSTGGADGSPDEVSYGASKAALESLSRAAAVELGRYGVTVNVVRPGPTRTGWLPPQAERSLVEQTPLRRLAEPEDVADAILLLVSEQARHVTGQVLCVDGGYHLR
jgi:3-oxoacyl-[acyl-carrier protein] reductase